MSEQEAKLMIVGLEDIGRIVEKLKREAGRNAIIKVNRAMAKITKAIAEAAKTEAE